MVPLRPLLLRRNTILGLFICLVLLYVLCRDSLSPFCYKGKGKEDKLPPLSETIPNIAAGFASKAKSCVYPSFVLSAKDRYENVAGRREQPYLSDLDDPTARARVGPNPQTSKVANFTVIYYFASPKPRPEFVSRKSETDEEDLDRESLNLLAEEENIIDDTKITYATHATQEFLVENLLALQNYWPNDPISVSVYSPGEDYCTSVALISWLWTCKPSIRKWVSFHVFFPSDFASEIAARSAAEGVSILDVNCDIDPVDSLENVSSYRASNHLPYPINTARNIARGAARTRFVIVSDIELYPSPELSSKFLSYYNSQSGQELPKLKESPLVYVVPIFEIESHLEIPKTKSELLRLYNDGKAVYFHKNTCVQCQKFPGLKAWLAEAKNTTEVSVVKVGSRNPPYHHWEPIYIGTQDDPMYDERLVWEGFHDKMTQMQELCLLKYRFATLDNVFLVHKPGIKQNHKLKKGAILNKEELWREPFVKRNQKYYRKINKELKKTYGANKLCPH